MPVNIDYNNGCTHKYRSIVNTKSENVMVVIDMPFFFREFSYLRNIIICLLKVGREFCRFPS